jgi:disulfide bond formation protein DsbB
MGAPSPQSSDEAACGGKGAEMVFPKLLDASDMQWQLVPLMMMPWLLLAVMGDIWAATLGVTVEPPRAD